VYLLFMFANPSGFDDEKTLLTATLFAESVAVAVAVAVVGVGVGVGVLNIERSPLDFVFLAESAVESDAGLVAVAGFADTVEFPKRDCILSLSSMILFTYLSKSVID
jgi:hypothetical protein